MNIVTLDFEVYFDSDYSLKRLTTEAFVRDPRFEVLGVGIRINEGKSVYSEFLTDIPHLKQELTTLGVADQSAVLCHHAHFDCLILNHWFGIKPKLILDTLSMARLVLGTNQSLSLESLAAHFGLPAKSVPYQMFKGRHWSDLTPQEQAALSAGCLGDVSLTWSIFQELAKDFPASELAVVDATIRCFSEPSLEADLPLLGKIWTDEQGRKRALVEELGLSNSDLQSSEQFAGLLRAAGVEPATKPSPANPDNKIYAFAKTDDFMRALAEEGSPAGSLARARLGIKSSINQTRAERIGDMGSRGPLCIYLAPYTAHTLRWGGGDKTNFQNFPRAGEIRSSICAPKGYLLAKADASQIEARLLNSLAGQVDVVEKFRAGEDIYVQVASAFYGREVTRADKPERGLGKQIELSCGYGSGAETIIATAKKGSYGPPLNLTPEEGLKARDLYRSTHQAVVAYWGQAGRLLARIAGGAPTE